MFESVELTDMDQNEFSLGHTPFCQSVINGCGSARIIATYIKRCLFSANLDVFRSKLELQTLSAAALGLMPNVEELNLTNISITKDPFRSMIKLECLTSLSLDRISWGEDDEDLRKLSVLRLKSLRFFKSLDDSPMFHDYTLFIPSLCLDSLLTLHTNCVSFIEHIAEQDCLLPLQELDIDICLNVELLTKAFFQKIPALKILRILNVEPSQHEIQFDDVLPALEELCCPSFLLQSLIPGRPIQSIKITTIKWELTNNTLFDPSTSRIRCLPDDIYQRVWMYYRRLESLRRGGGSSKPHHISQTGFREGVFTIFFFFSTSQNTNSCV